MWWAPHLSPAGMFASSVALVEAIAGIGTQRSRASSASGRTDMGCGACQPGAASRPRKETTITLEAIALRLEAGALSLEAIDIRDEKKKQKGRDAWLRLRISRQHDKTA